jgi:hypothetical protein
MEGMNLKNHGLPARGTFYSTKARVAAEISRG